MSCKVCNDTGLITHSVERYGIELEKFCDRCSFGTALWRERKRADKEGVRTGLIWGASVILVMAFMAAVML